MELLSRSLLKKGLPVKVKTGPVEEFPVKVIQFGEGNFMRAFIDWMIDELNSAGIFKGMVQQIQPIEQGLADKINAQDGLYTLRLQGVKDGKVVEQEQIITCVRGCLNPYSQWEATISAFCGNEVSVVFSNTTEAGISYRFEKYEEGKTPVSYPAKITALLYERFKAFNGAEDKGLLFIPCELIDRNGATLKDYVMKHASDWELGSAFTDWVDNSNHFVNTLVDRIVAGYPGSRINGILDRLGYEDRLVDCGEIFHFFVIEGSESLSGIIPFQKIGLDVVWTDNQKPYRTRKVRFLNGGHTSSVSGALLGGLDFVDEMMDDPVFGRFVETAIKDEIFHTVDLPVKEKTFFADSVIERFKNPFAGHRLMDISLNSTSKWEVRVLPSILDYVKIRGTLPKALAFSMASLIAFYKVEKEGEIFIGRSRSNPYQVKDDSDRLEVFEYAWNAWEKDKDYRKLVTGILSRKEWWKMDLNTVPGMTDFVAEALSFIKTDGIRAAVKRLLPQENKAG
jgi:tagaturonate reductase